MAARIEMRAFTTLVCSLSLLELSSPSVILELSPSDFKPEDQSYQDPFHPSPSHCNCSSITFERGDWRMREVHAASASGEVTCSYAELVAET
jgi:hypothetical protein